jgi:hypothetical protein
MTGLGSRMLSVDQQDGPEGAIVQVYAGALFKASLRPAWRSQTYKNDRKPRRLGELPTAKCRIERERRPGLRPRLNFGVGAVIYGNGRIVESRLGLAGSNNEFPVQPAAFAELRPLRAVRISTSPRASRKPSRALFA